MTVLFPPPEIFLSFFLSPSEEEMHFSTTPAQKKKNGCSPFFQLPPFSPFLSAVGNHGRIVSGTFLFPLRHKMKGDGTPLFLAALFPPIREEIRRPFPTLLVICSLSTKALLFKSFFPLSPHYRYTKAFSLPSHGWYMDKQLYLSSSLPTPSFPPLFPPLAEGRFGGSSTPPCSRRTKQPDTFTTFLSLFVREMPMGQGDLPLLLNRVGGGVRRERHSPDYPFFFPPLSGMMIWRKVPLFRALR